MVPSTSPHLMSLPSLIYIFLNLNLGGGYWLNLMPVVLCWFCLFLASAGSHSFEARGMSVSHQIETLTAWRPLSFVAARKPLVFEKHRLHKVK